MTHANKIVSFLIAVLLVSIPAHAQDTTPADKGKAIGETINAALNAALPGATAIGTLIKGFFGSKDEAKLKKDDVQKALDDQSKKQKADAQAQLKKLSSAVDEITAANELANAALVANQSLAGTNQLLTLPGDAGWTAFKAQWEAVATPNLKKVTDFDPKKLGNISNENIQAEWQAFANGYLQTAQNINTAITQHNNAVAISKVDQLTASLTKLQTIPSIELKAFGRELAGLANQADTAQNVQPPPVPESETLKGLVKQGTLQ
jgi:hypothetical protein